MKCPTCPDATLLMSERSGVEIDYCPSCRGVWLDRGELDKLVQLASQSANSVQPHRQPHPDHARRDFDDSDFGRRSHGGQRRKSWLSEIFD